MTSSTGTFGTEQQSACYNQSVVNDDFPEPIESFVVRIMDNLNITVGTPRVSQINITDDDGSEFSESNANSVRDVYYVYLCESMTLKLVV